MAINIQPKGLLGLLQLKTGGRYPQNLGEQLSPTWDLRENYEETNAVVDRSTGFAYATGANAWIRLFGGATAPETGVGTWCYVIRATWIWIPQDTADTFDGVPSILDPNFPAFNEPVGPRFQFTTAADLGQVSASVEGFWLPPGYDFGLQQVRAIDTATTATFARVMRYVAYGP